MKKFLIGFLVLGLWACSTDDDKQAAPAPASAPEPKLCEAEWQAAKAVVVKNCAGCHNGTSKPALLPQAVFDVSPVAALVNSGKMPPPPRRLSAEDKEALKAYLECSLL